MVDFATGDYVVVVDHDVDGGYTILGLDYWYPLATQMYLYSIHLNRYRHGQGISSLLVEAFQLGIVFEFLVARSFTNLYNAE